MASFNDDERNEPFTAEDRLRHWLVEINLQQYADRFCEEGYDDMTQIILMNEKEVDEMLEETGVGNQRRQGTRSDLSLTG